MKKIKYITFGSILVVVALIMSIFLQTTSRPPSPPPNWKDPKIGYSIIKKNDMYLVRYSLKGNEGEYYVGKSSIVLDYFVGKTVSIKGDFPMSAFDKESNQQCIRNICKPIFNPKLWEEPNQRTSVIDIYAIIEIK